MTFVFVLPIGSSKFLESLSQATESSKSHGEPPQHWGVGADVDEICFENLQVVVFTPRFSTACFSVSPLQLMSKRT